MCRRCIVSDGSGDAWTKRSLVKIVNSNDIPEQEDRSPKGSFGGFDIEVSKALGRKPNSTDLLERHPFDVAISRIPPGMKGCPYHAHSSQWEFYHVISGAGAVRHADGVTPIAAGDAFIFKPGEAHQIINDGAFGDLIYYCVADNPIGESCYYPDSGKWIVYSPERRLMRSEPLDYFDGEE
jgi:uncharacterized cupin superfamily protein